MAIFSGDDGSATFDGNLVINLTGWTLETTQNTVNASVMDDDWETFLTLKKGFTGSLSFHYDQENTAHKAIAETSSATVVLYYEKQATYGTPVTGDQRLSGSVIVTRFSVSAGVDSVLTATCDFQGTGAVTIDAVT